MRYTLLIYEEEANWAAFSDEDRGKLLQEYFDFHTWVNERGAFVAGEPLTPVSTATTVRVRDGQTLTTDGPFAETKEQLGGFYLIEAADLDEALEIAAKVPSARLGSIEVRPVLDMSPREDGR